MNRSLDRRFTAAVQSPFYLDWVQSREGFTANLEKVCIEADTEENLSEPLRQFLDQCDASTEAAIAKGYRYPYSQVEINDVVEGMA